MNTQRRIALALVLVVAILLEAARVYIWDIGGGIYETTVVIYAAGMLTVVGVAAILYWVWKLP